IAPPRLPLIERKTVSFGHIVRPGVTDPARRAPESNLQSARQVVAEDPVEKIALRHRPDAIDHARVDRDDREAVRRPLARHQLGDPLRALVIGAKTELGPLARLVAGLRAGRTERADGGGVENAPHTTALRRPQDGAEPLDVHAVELAPVLAPHLEQRRHVAWRAAPVEGPAQ